MNEPRTFEPLSAEEIAAWAATIDTHSPCWVTDADDLAAMRKRADAVTFSYRVLATLAARDEQIRAARTEIARLKDDNDRLRAELLRRESVEAGVCPEDVGIVEYVTALNEKIARLTEELEGWRESARRAAEGGHPDEKHCTCVGPLTAELDKVRAELEEMREALRDSDSWLRGVSSNYVGSEFEFAVRTLTEGDKQ